MVLRVFVFVIVLALVTTWANGRSFTIDGDWFVKDGEQFRIVSGAFHYFRTPPEYWADRLHKMRLGGLNTVETYVPWNLHELTPETYDFEGLLNIEAFLQAINDEGLLAIVRPSPYICAEWEFGGLPSWLLSSGKPISLRNNNDDFVPFIDRYYSVLLPKLKPFMYSSGGPIVAMQIENEYGSYGNDHDYLEHMIATYQSNGLDCIYFASNGPTDQALQAGAVDSVLRTINFGTGSDPAPFFETLRIYQPTGPLFVTEWWDGWFDHWGEDHHTVTPESASVILDEILAYQNASVSMYMYTGGTNFNFWNGANFDSYYQPTITSYDYDAPISENGDVSEKFSVLRDTIGKYISVPTEIPAALPKKAYGNVTMQPIARILDPLVLAKLSPEVVTSPRTMTMEELGQNFGFVLYETSVQGPLTNAVVNIQDCHDRALIFLDGKYQGVVDRGTNVAPSVRVSTDTLSTLQILVENEGRINFGPYLEDFKGITQGVRLPDMFLFDWTMYPLPLDNIDVLPTSSFTTTSNDPAFCRGYFNIPDTPVDTFVSLEGWGKGVCYVNGVNIGRYWPTKGPQQTLFLPAPYLKQGQNEIVLFELSKFSTSITLVDTQNLG